MNTEINGLGHLIVTLCLMGLLGFLLFFNKLDTATAMTALGFALGYWYRTTNAVTPKESSPPAFDTSASGEENTVKMQVAKP